MGEPGKYVLSDRSWVPRKRKKKKDSRGLTRQTKRTGGRFLLNGKSEKKYMKKEQEEICPGKQVLRKMKQGEDHGKGRFYQGKDGSGKKREVSCGRDYEFL